MSDSPSSGALPKAEGHTFKRFDAELSQIHLKVLEMGGLALAQLKDALGALKTKNLALVHSVAQREAQMDQLEVATDGNIVDLLAKRSPLGGDLRMVIALSRSVTDFEVIGDEALRIANIAQQLYGGDSSDPNEHLLRDVSLMGAFAVTSLEKLLRSVDGLDDTLANELLDVRHRLEDEFEAGLRRLVTYVMQDSRNIGFAVSTVLTIKALERIGSHVQNVAESIIYQVQGTDIRHQGD